jgi:hypothetical protein
MITSSWYLLGKYSLSVVSVTQVATHARRRAAAVAAVAAAACMPVHVCKFMHACTQQQQQCMHAYLFMHTGTCVPAHACMLGQAAADARVRTKFSMACVL